MDTKGPQTYDAQGEWMKTVNRERTSGNIPASVMRQAQHHIVDALQNNTLVKASMSPGFSARVSKWNTLTSEQKYVLAGEIADADEIKAAIIMEEDTEMMRHLTGRMDDIRAAESGKE